MEGLALPIPEIAEALRPYIKTREEVLNIRQNLHSHLEKQVRTEGTGFSSINLTRQRLSQTSGTSSISGVRKAYLKALEAHTIAQAKHDALRAELEQLKHPKAGDRASQETTLFHSGDYIAHLRQKETHRKLKVIDHALSQIVSSDDAVSAGSIEDAVRKQVGELPIPPSLQPAAMHHPETQAKIMELKKAVVLTKRRVDQQRNHTAATAMIDGNEVSAEAELAGLQKALQRLTVWMEDRLAIIAENEMEQEIPRGVDRDGTDDVQHLSIQNIEALYDRYLSARHRLVRKMHAFSDAQSPPEVSEFQFDRSIASTAHSVTSSLKSSAATILPYVPALTAAKAQEQSLVQQSVFLRRQISTAEDDTARLIQRLADESHLVHPGASRGKDWAGAAEDAGRATDQSVRERVTMGERCVESAQKSMSAIKALPNI